MANRIFRGDAVPIAQVVKTTPVNPEVGDQFTIKINSKQVDFVATDNLVSSMVEGLLNAWNSADFPEANQIAASPVDEDNDGIVDALELKANTPGVPFRVQTSATDGAGFLVQVQTVTEGDPGQNEIQQVSLPNRTSDRTFRTSR